MKRRAFGAAAASAVAALVTGGQAQQRAVPTIGFISTRAAADSGVLVDAFRRGLSGYFKESSVAFAFRWADGDYARMPALVADILNQKIDVLVAVGGEPSAQAAKAATSSVPIVFIVGGDPVKLGLVESFSRPGGNATGFNLLSSSIESKRLGTLRDVVPNATDIGILVNSKFSSFINYAAIVEQAARSINQRVEIFDASNDAELRAAMTAIAAKQIDGLLVSADPFFDTRRDVIIANVSAMRVPAIYQSRDYAVAGGLLSYGISYPDIYRQAGVYAGLILKGAHPGALPVMQPTKFELVINLKTARALGLTMSQVLLVQADELIE